MMRFNQKIGYLIVVLTLFCAPLLSAGETDLYTQAKLMLFDREWERALVLLNEIINDYPNGKYFALALFYKGRCLEESKKTKQALGTYSHFLDVATNKNLREEATVAVIDLSFKLFEKGEKGHIERVMGFLKSKQKSVRYYAAFKLSYAKQKSLARRAVPILKRMISEEKDEELRDRGRIALLRIDPEYLKETQPKKMQGGYSLHIQVFDKKERRITFSLSIPLALAKPALESIPREERHRLARHGYDIDRILRQLVKDGEILKVVDDDTIFKLWVE